MVFWNRPVHESALLIAAICLNFSAGSAAGSQSPQAQAGQQPSSQTPAAARSVGTIKSISGNAITLTTDTGGDVTVQVQDATKLVRIAPGQKDLKEATPIQLADVQPGDRILVRGKLAERSEEHTSELQSRLHLVCRLLLEKKKRSHIIILYH